MVDKIRWGIKGTGYIAGVFAEGLSFLPDAELVAVGSRSTSSANQFADRHDVPHRHSSYEALIHDPDVDVVYIGTPHPFHVEHILLSLSAGKPVPHWRDRRGRAGGNHIGLRERGFGSVLRHHQS